MLSLINLLCRCFEFDIEVMSQPWMYYLFFPAFFYMLFMMAK